MTTGQDSKANDNATKYGQWVASTESVGSRSVYRLSGGLLTDTKTIKEKTASMLGVPMDRFDGMRVYSKALSDSCSYWVAYNMDDVNAVGDIERDSPYYETEKLSITYEIVVNMLLFLSVFGTFSFQSAQSFSFWTTICFILVFPLSFTMTGHILLWQSNSNMTIALKNGYLTNTTSFFPLSAPRLIFTRFRRLLSKNIRKFGPFGNYSIYDEHEKHDVEYDTNEAMSFLRKDAEVHEVGDGSPKVIHGELIRSQQDDISIMKRDIISKIDQELPKGSAVYVMIMSMLDNDEIDEPTLARVEASLNELQQNKRDEATHMAPLDKVS
jgi:hypothetical protein